MVARLAAFLLLCIGVQILGNGVQELLTPVLHGVAVPRYPEPKGAGRRSRPYPPRAAPALLVPWRAVRAAMLRTSSLRQKARLVKSGC